MTKLLLTEDREIGIVSEIRGDLVFAFVTRTRVDGTTYEGEVVFLLSEITLID